jgi:cytochrome c biogenesis protein CcmG/thiol:disulfide interchange protein DsbE
MDGGAPGRARRAGWMIAGGAVLVGLAAGLALLNILAPEAAVAPDATHVPVPAAVVGAPAPDFELKTLDGTSIRLSDLKGKVVAVNFWATWCEPCRIEMPDLEARAESHAADLVVLGVNFDESPEDVRAFGKRVGVAFPLLLDPGGVVQHLYRVLGYPTTFFVDRDGVIRAEHVGLMTPAQIDDYLAQAGIGS